MVSIKTNSIKDLKFVVFEIEREILLVKTLFAKLEKFNFPGEIFPDNFFGGLQNRRLVDVPVYL